MFKTPNEIQRVDPKCNLIMPWYTFPCLDFLISLDVSQMDVYEWGGGCSTVWYSCNCKSVTTIENNKGWAKEIDEYLRKIGKSNYSIDTIEVPESANSPHPLKDRYLSYIDQVSKDKYDIIAIDGSYRNEAIERSIEHIKQGGHIIFDNYEQDTSGYQILPNKDLLSKYPMQVYAQPDRPYWKTAVWRIED